jgi:hypothetical protein
MEKIRNLMERVASLELQNQVRDALEKQGIEISDIDSRSVTLTSERDAFESLAILKREIPFIKGKVDDNILSW